MQEALEIARKRVALYEKSLNESDECYLHTLNGLAMVHSKLGRHEKAVHISDKVLAIKKESWSDEVVNSLDSRYELPKVYHVSGQHQTALEMLQHDLEKCSKILAEDHPHMLNAMVMMAVQSQYIGEPEKGILPIIKAL